jgi:hypothetical protein
VVRSTCSGTTFHFPFFARMKNTYNTSDEEAMISMAMQPSQEAQGPSMSRSEAWSSSSSTSQGLQQHQTEGMIENSFYQQNHDYHPYGSSWHPQSQLMQQHSQNRSSPIAIIRGLDVQDQTADSDSDESIIDVELDAIKLSKQYGRAEYYQEDQEDKKALKAPYLGSSTKSENLILSLPTITLSDGNDDYQSTPPEIVSYGSLRDSHQKGRFLDGPSSYREPRSGRIMRLDDRLRYQAAPTSSQSISERIEQARKLNEIKKQQQKDSRENGNGAGNTSSLSEMMNDAPQQKENQSSTLDYLGMETHIPKFDEHEEEEPPSMMSTSLTAFEILQTSTLVGDERKLGTSVGRYQNSLLVAEIADGQLKPLERSMSDPFPHPHGASFQTFPNPHDGSFHSLRFVHPMQQQQPQPQAAVPAAMNVNGVGANYAPAMMYDGTSQQHNPDMDGAFDMDV